MRYPESELSALLHLPLLYGVAPLALGPLASIIQPFPRTIPPHHHATEKERHP
jgi:hypothetical protein